MEVPGAEGKVGYRKEGRRRKEPTTQGGVGWNPREPMGVPSGKLLENTEGDSADKMITWNCLNIRYSQVVRGTARNSLNRCVPDGTHGGVGGRLFK
jgi:hypothetical protein